MITVGNEKYKFKLYKRVENSPYEWESTPSVYFKGRPANRMEQKVYRIMQGVNGNTDSIFVICSNLPKQVKPKDKVSFLGKEWSVASTGYYFDEARFVNVGIFSDEYIAKRCPKGIVLE